MSPFTESHVESAALDWLEALGWQVAHGPDIAPDTLLAERRDFSEVVLARRLRDALRGSMDAAEYKHVSSASSSSNTSPTPSRSSTPDSKPNAARAIHQQLAGGIED